MFCLSRSDYITLSSMTNKIRTDVIVARPKPIRFEIDPMKYEGYGRLFWKGHSDGRTCSGMVRGGNAVGQRVSRKYKTCGEDSRVIDSAAKLLYHE